MPSADRQGEFDISKVSPGETPTNSCQVQPHPAAGKSRSTTIAADIALLLATMVWGSTFVMVKGAVATYPVFRFLAMRFTIAAVALLIPSFRRFRTAKWGQVRAGVLVGLFLFAGFAFQTAGLKYTSAAKAGFITGLAVVIVPILATLLLRAKPTPQACVGVLFSTAGLALLSLNADLSIGVGDILLVCCAASFALHIVSVSKFAPQMDTWVLTVAQMATVAVLSWAFSGLLGEPGGAPPRAVWNAAAFTGVLATAAAFGVQTAVQRFTSPTHTALILVAEPVFAALAGYLLAGEELTTRTLLGGLLILIGMVAGEIPSTDKVAVWTSRLLNPAVTILPPLVTASFKSVTNLAGGIKWFALTIGCSIVIPLLAIMWELRRGRISDWFISNRRQRLRPSLIGSALAGSLLPLGAIAAFAGPAELLAVYITGLVLVVLVMGVTTVWKISHHATTVASAATMMCAFFGAIALPFVVLVPLTAWSRVRLRAHTPLQVIAGASMGIGATLVCFGAMGLI